MLLGAASSTAPEDMDLHRSVRASAMSPWPRAQPIPELAAAGVLDCCPTMSGDLLLWETGPVMAPRIVQSVGMPNGTFTIPEPFPPTLDLDGVFDGPSLTRDGRTAVYGGELEGDTTTGDLWIVDRCDPSP